MNGSSVVLVIMPLASIIDQITTLESFRYPAVDLRIYEDVKRCDFEIFSLVQQQMH